MDPVTAAATRAAKAVATYRRARRSGDGSGGLGWWKWLVPVVALAMAAAGCVTLAVVTTVFGGGEEESAVIEGAVNAGVIPPAALELLPDVQRILAASCPELPAPWLIAEVEAESSWNPRAYSSAGAAGLTQMLRTSWGEAAGDIGNWPAGDRPVDSHPVWEPVTHLEYAIPWMCTNLRTISQHLLATGKPITALQAMAVCHIAGCSRVTGSATGLPAPGEAGCGEQCAAEVRAYVERITELAAVYAAVPEAGPTPEGLPAPPVPYTGEATGCVEDDPTSTGCLTGAASHLFVQVGVAFGGRWPWGIGCWDAHAWNPTSDHPRGRACDFAVGRLGEFPGDTDRATGWVLAEWLRANAAALQVRYVIYQGKIWQLRRADRGWAPYDGGGVYDPSDPTGGHYDHVHVSTSQ